MHLCIKSNDGEETCVDALATGRAQGCVSLLSCCLSSVLKLRCRSCLFVFSVEGAGSYRPIVLYPAKREPPEMHYGEFSFILIDGNLIYVSISTLISSLMGLIGRYVSVYLMCRCLFALCADIPVRICICL